MFKLLTLILTTIATITAQVPPGWPRCVVNSLIDVSFLEFYPNPPIAGSDFQVNLTGISTVPITTGAYFNVKGKWGLLTVFDDNIFVCDAKSAIAGDICQPAGIQNFFVKKSVPKETKTGVEIGVKITAVNGDGSVLACFSGKITVK